eukprot:TRINITY_DN969_c1_g2_i1.p1 TRINITY_DN969_c1_g2~~TRINITY_DN969_c1_g2_i1.p1  ORF type:complete len:723 (+),score=220.61 TRINITY_DN969_c1_g2_i1:50-2170(+)
MVRIGLRKKGPDAPAPQSQPVPVEDDDMTSSAAETTESEDMDEGAGQMPYPRDWAYEQIYAESQAQQQQQQQGRDADGEGYRAELQGTQWEPQNPAAMLTDVLKETTLQQVGSGVAPWGHTDVFSASTARTPAAPKAEPVAAPAPAAEPVALTLQPTVGSTAYDKMATHPDLHAAPLMAFGLSFRTPFVKGGGLLLPGHAKIGPVIDPTKGNAANAAPTVPSAAGPVSVQILEGGLASATGCLAALAGRAAQPPSDDEGRVVFDLLSAPAAETGVPAMLNSKVLDDVAAALHRTAGDAPAALDRVACEEAENTVRLVKALWGNTEADDTTVPQRAAGFGAAAAADGLSAGYESVNRGRKLREWLRVAAARRSAARRRQSGAEEDVVQLAMGGARSDAAQKSRQAGNAGAAALLLMAKQSARVRGLLAGLPEAQRTPATDVSQARPSLHEAPARGAFAKGDAWRWRERLQHAFDLSTGAGDATTTTALRATTAAVLSELRCPPPYYEALAAGACESEPHADAQLKTVGAERSDVCWHLLMLWAKGGEREALVDPTTHLCDPCTWTHRVGDVSVNWVLCLLLSTAPGVSIRIPTERVDQLAAAFADQLYNAGQWRWALFVLLTIADPAARKAQVLRVLTRHYDDVAAGPLLPTLPHVAVPHAWVAQAKQMVTPDPPVVPQPVPTPLPFASYFETDALVGRLLEGVYAA